MHITLIPQRRDDRLSLSKSGDLLTVNGEDFELSGIPDGAILPREAVACEWLASDIERIDGVLHLSLILPHGAQAPAEALFPGPITIAADGAIPLPAGSLPEEEPADA